VSAQNRVLDDDMGFISLLSDADLLARLPALVRAECHATAEVVEHLVEVERRRLYLEQACSSIYKYCEERLGYSEDAARKRGRVAKLALRLPRALDELRRGALHLTGLYLLEQHLTEENAEVLFTEARGKSRRELEVLIARRFPRPDVSPSIQGLGATPSGTGHPASGPGPQSSGLGTGTLLGPRIEPLAPERYRFEFTASAEFRAKFEQARELLSHAVPSGDLAVIFERALDELLARELKRRIGAGKPRQHRKVQPDSRHVPVEIARQVRERDGGQCTFHDAEGRRCTERRFLTIEHRQPFALRGPPTLENLCLLCGAHQGYTARKVFGETFIEEKRAERRKRNEPEKPVTPEPLPKPDVFDQVLGALCGMGFPKRKAAAVMAQLELEQAEPEAVPLIRAAVDRLTPPDRFYG
jgi:hypothetical protein